MKNRILLTVTNDLVYDQRMQRISATLANAGYEVWLVGRMRPSSPALDEKPYRQIRLKCHWEKGKLFYLEFNLRLFFFLFKNAFSAICAIDLDTLGPAFVVSKLKNKPCLYDAHEYFTEVPEVERRPAVKLIWEVLARLIVPRLKYCYTVGHALADALSLRYGVPFEVVRNVPLAAKPAPALSKPQKPIILYQGVLNEGRGLEAAIAAMPHIPDAEFWLAGEGDLSDELRILSRQYKVENQVRFLGYLRPAALKEITPQATIGINLLENRGLSYYYSLANKAFDYIQHGIPSLQMDFPEYRRLNEQYSTFLLLEHLTPEAIAEKINKLLKSNNLYKEIQFACQRAANELTWENEQKILLDIYQKVLPLYPQ